MTELETVTERLKEIRQQISDTAGFLATKRDCLYTAAHEIAELERQLICLQMGAISLDTRRLELLEKSET